VYSEETLDDGHRTVRNM